MHDILSVWTLELLERIETMARRTGSLGRNNYAVMGGMLARLKLCVNCPLLLDLQELDSFHRRQQQRDRDDQLAAAGEEDVDMDVPRQLPTAMGMEDGINILSASEAEKHFVVGLSVGTGYNRAGMQVLLDMAAGGALSTSSSSSSSAQLQEEEEEEGGGVLACPVCLDEGEAVERPVFLPCLHALCRDCALDLLEASGETAGSRNEFLFCPFNCNSGGVGGAALRRGYNRASLVEVVRAAPKVGLSPSSSSSSSSSCSSATLLEEDEEGHKRIDVSDGGSTSSSCVSSSLQLSATKCLSSWASLEAISPPLAEQRADSIRPSAEFPSLPAMMLAHFRTLTSSGASSTKLHWLKSMIQELLREDITNKILILVENNAIVEGICAALEADLMPTAATATATRLRGGYGYKGEGGYGEEEMGGNSTYAGKSYVRVDSTGNQGYRAQQINLFTDDPTIAVCVATRSIAGVGLNLTMANVVVLFDPAPTLGEESQAVNRVLRLGQTRAVRIFRVYMQHSVEERLLSWRKQKGELDSNVMSSSSFSVQSQGDGDAWDDGEEAERTSGTGDNSSGSGSGSGTVKSEVAKKKKGGRGTGPGSGGGGSATAGVPVLKEWRGEQATTY